MESVAVVLAEKEEDVAIGVGWLDGEIVVEDFAGGESRVEEILVGFVVEEVEGGPVAVRENAFGGEAGRLVVVNQFAGQGGYDVGDIQFDGLPCLFDRVEEGAERFEAERLASNGPIAPNGFGIRVRRDHEFDQVGSGSSEGLEQATGLGFTSREV